MGNGIETQRAAPEGEPAYPFAARHKLAAGGMENVGRHGRRRRRHARGRERPAHDTGRRFRRRNDGVGIADSLPVFSFGEWPHGYLRSQRVR